MKSFSLRNLVLTLAVAGALVCPAAAQTTERDEVRRAVSERPSDPWPRGVGHVVLAPPGSREDWKGYHEPGGNFSPTVGSFGVSIWAFDTQGRLATTSDAIPPEQIDQRLDWGTAQRIPSIRTQTPFYECRWSLVGPVAVHRTWRLELSRGREHARLALVLRSVGPAGGPVRALDWDGTRLRIDDRWSVVLAPPPVAVSLGEEGATGWLELPSSGASIRRWTGDTGWGYAALALADSPQTRIEIEDAHPMPLPGLRYEGTRSGLQVTLPDPRFTASLDAQVAHLMMGLVGRETRPGEPTNYPLAWLRDGAYTVVALARAGQLDAARQLATYFAENDFFGGFGPEADAPGLALWAIEEVSARVRDHEFDEWLWPYVFRKAEFILEMLDARQPIRKLVRGPIVPEHWDDPELSLVCEPARDGLIIGRMDWHRPVLFVNAVSYRGLLSAAALAQRQEHRQHAARWRERAADLQRAWWQAFQPPESENERTFISGLWPTWIAASDAEAFRRGLAARWEKLRDAQGGFREPRLWTYFDLAEAHQWLFLGQPQRTWNTLEWYWGHQASPGLYTWWEGQGEENTFHQWERVRGWVNPPHVTPHYWTAAEMLLLQMDMLAYLDESAGEPTLVVGAGVPAGWLDRPLSVRGVSTRIGQVDWWWKDRAMDVVVRGGRCKVRLGPAFAPGTPVRLRTLNP